jgi:hypothetical protein
MIDLNPESGTAERSRFVERGRRAGILHHLLEQSGGTRGADLRRHRRKRCVSCIRLGQPD